MAHDQPEIIDELRVKLEELLRDEGIKTERAQCIAFKISESVRLDFGGMTLYIPKGRSNEPSKRDMEIFNKFNGNNRNTLCREYNISTSRLYQILNEINDYMTRKNQMGLFPND